MPDILLFNSKNSVTIDPYGAQVMTWRHMGVDLLYQGHVTKRTGIPLLFPYYGTSGPAYPQHGFGRNTLWQVGEVSVTKASFHLCPADITADYFKYSFDATYEVCLSGDALQIILSVKNMGDIAMPLAPGLHPYWNIAHSAKRELKIANIDGFDSRQLDWDSTPPDREYDFADHAAFAVGGSQIRITSTNDTVGKIVVWSLPAVVGQPKEAKDYDFVCVEPVSHGRLDFPDNCALVAPGATYVFRVEFGVV